jgi:hypothetical protein
VQKPQRKNLTQRIYLEAVVIGVGIGAAALTLDQLVGDASWPMRGASLLFVGGLICLVQYGLKRAR